MYGETQITLYEVYKLKVKEYKLNGCIYRKDHEDKGNT